MKLGPESYSILTWLPMGHTSITMFVIDKLKSKVHKLIGHVKLSLIQSYMGHKFKKKKHQLTKWINR